MPSPIANVPNRDFQLPTMICIFFTRKTKNDCKDGLFLLVYIIFVLSFSIYVRTSRALSSYHTYLVVGTVRTARLPTNRSTEPKNWRAEN